MKKINNKVKRKLRNRKKLKKVNNDRYRISVSKSLNNLFIQIIDDKNKKTLVSASSIEKEVKVKVEGEGVGGVEMGSGGGMLDIRGCGRGEHCGRW